MWAVQEVVVWIPLQGTNLYLFKNAEGYWLAELGGVVVMSPLTNEQVSKLLNRQ